jgi:hypothetical protein
VQFPELGQFQDQYLNDQFSYDITALLRDTQVEIPENAAVEVVPQPVPRQEAAPSYNEGLRVFEPGWRSNDGSYPEDFSFAVNNVTNFGQAGSSSNPLIILDDAGPSQRQLLVGDPGPSSSQNYQQAGTLAGFEALPPDQRLSGLPHPLNLLEETFEFVTERYNTLPEGDARFMAFGDIFTQFIRIADQYAIYLNGMQVSLGDQLYHWLRIAANPGSSPALVATEFQRTYILPNEFMQRVDLSGTRTPFEGFPAIGPEFFDLPRYEGVAYFWGRNQHSTLSGRFRELWALPNPLGVQSWFRTRSMCRLLNL